MLVAGSSISDASSEKNHPTFARRKEIEKMEIDDAFTPGGTWTTGRGLTH